MSVNSSSSSDSLLHRLFPSGVLDLQCFISRPGSFIFTTYSFTYILLILPLCIFILHHGLQLWKRSTSSAATVSHSDCFTYHMVVMEMVGVVARVLSCCGVYTEDLVMMFVGGVIFSFTWYGETSFHILTCVERYLAVVHPITYRSLRNQRGTRIRNISIACVWLLCLFWTLVALREKIAMSVNFCILISCLVVSSFCSLSVLRVLIRPGPGEQAGGGERADQSKLRAFYTIMTILGVLELRFVWSMIWVVLHLSEERFCPLLASTYWFTLPSSLVLPLLFLHRAGQLVCCRNNSS